LLLALASCQGDGGGEGVALSWTFGPDGLGCDAAGVQTVHVFIGPLEPTGSYDQEVQCAAGETGSMHARGVAPGRHVFVLKGVANNNVLYELQQEITVSGNDLGRFVLDPYTPP
jgi:hypothetical protein